MDNTAIQQDESVKTIYTMLHNQGMDQEKKRVCRDRDRLCPDGKPY